jgi:signal transduction histidine kinase
MNDLTAFFVDNLIYIYFFYGVAFFSMGLAVALEARQASELSLAQGAWLLAAFGLMHGCHEWAEMFLLINGPPLFPLHLAWIYVAVLAVSFQFLLIFGVKLLPRGQRDPNFVARMAILASVAYLMQVAIVRFTFQPSPEEWVKAANVLARYSLGIPGGVLTSLALIRQRRAFDLGGTEHYGRSLVWAATAFAWYSIVGQSFPPSSIIFPSMFVNTETFMHLFGFPVQALRASMAALMAYFIIRALRAFGAESQLRLQKSREAERRGQRMLAQLNRELQAAARELSLLYEASRLLTTPLDPETLLHEAITKIVAIVEPVKAGAILAKINGDRPVRHRVVFGSEGDTLTERVKAVGYSDSTIRLSDLSPVWVSDDGEDVTEEVDAQRLSPPGSQVHAIQFVTLPLRTRDKLLGYLMLETDPEGPYLSSAEAPTIEALARQLAIAVENALLLHATRLSDARRGELLQRITAAQEAERQRIARELHDETGQALTGLALALSSVGQLIQTTPETAVAQVTQLRDMCTSAIDELRHLINYLRPSQLDDLGLVAALRWHVEQLDQRSPTEFGFEIMGTPRRLTPEAETTLFRIAQEGLNNVVKHASAKSAVLQIEFTENTVELCLFDNGHGFDVKERLQPGAGLAWGLVGIQERATLAGGELTINSTPGKGTWLELHVPMVTLDSEDGHE